MNRKYLVIFFLLLARVSFAQQGKFVIHFVDESKNTSPGKVTVIDKNGKPISAADSEGYAILPLTAFSTSGYLLALCPGYKPDTIRANTSTVYLQPLSVTLKEALVTNSNIYRLLDKLNEYVVDYAFSGEDIIVATYSGNNGGHAKLFMVNKNGEILSRLNLDHEPVALYKSCVGIHYCVCYDKFYPITINGTKMSLSAPHDISLLEGMKQCEQSINGNLYYKLSDRSNFRTQYGMISKGSSTFRPFTTFEENEVAQASYQEWSEIQVLLAAGAVPGARKEAARKQLMRLKWDKGSFAHIDVPLMRKNDTLVIFDFFNKKLLWYNLSGDAIGRVPVNFRWHQSQQFEVIKDEVTERIYIHRYDRKEAQTLEELDISNGTTLPDKISISRAFAENVKVNDNDIYFLWQDPHKAATRQLFIQRTSLMISAK
jgi:hypothetical protein